MQPHALGFDDVHGHLIKRIEGKALAELSRRLSPISNAPIDVVRGLARDDNIVVAEPVLTASPRLTDNDLIDIASAKTQAHLLAISARLQIGPAVTDVLLQRGDRDVFHKLVGNSGAEFSETGFETRVRHSERDEQLAEKVGVRLDVPLRLFRELLLRATEAVRSRLLALAGPENRNQILSVLPRSPRMGIMKPAFRMNTTTQKRAPAWLLCDQPTGLTRQLFSTSRKVGVTPKP